MGVRGLSQVGVSDADAIKATSSARSGRPSGGRELPLQISPQRPDACLVPPRLRGCTGPPAGWDQPAPPSRGHRAAPAHAVTPTSLQPQDGPGGQDSGGQPGSDALVISGARDTLPAQTPVQGVPSPRGHRGMWEKLRGPTGRSLRHNTHRRCWAGLGGESICTQATWGHWMGATQVGKGQEPPLLAGSQLPPLAATPCVSVSLATGAPHPQLPVPPLPASQPPLAVPGPGWPVSCHGPFPVSPSRLAACLLATAASLGWAAVCSHL